MDDMVGVSFKPTGKVYYFSAAGLQLEPGDQVVAETSKGQELAEVVCHGLFGGKPREAGELKALLRKATPEDVERSQENRRRASEARRVCQRLITQLEVPAKLVEVEFAFDGSRVTFALACEDRTDFRQLHRELREIYDCEVELRQVGVRDQAKILGGLGPCGRHLCCASFLRSFQPVTIKMAKDQDLSLNPTKISGLCGRLMCCLRYEHNVYRTAREGLPEVGATVETPEGAGEVAAVDVLRRRVTVTTADGTLQVAADDVKQTAPPRKRTAAGPPERAPTATPKRRERTRSAAAPGDEPTAAAASEATAAPPAEPGAAAEEAAAKKKRRRGRRSRRKRSGEESAEVAPDGQTGS